MGLGIGFSPPIRSRRQDLGARLEALATGDRSGADKSQTMTHGSKSSLMIRFSHHPTTLHPTGALRDGIQADGIDLSR